MQGPLTCMAVDGSGTHMVTAGVDGQVLLHRPKGFLPPFNTIGRFDPKLIDFTCRLLQACLSIMLFCTNVPWYAGGACEGGRGVGWGGG